MEYYEVTGQDGSRSVSVWDPQVHQMFSWIPNTECWHRDAAREQDFWFDRELGWERVEATRAGELVSETPHIDERSLGWVVDELRAQPDSDRRTSAELGVPVVRRRVLSEDLIARRIRLLMDPKVWVLVAVYPPGTKAPPLTLASDLRRGERVSLADLGPLVAKVDRQDDGWTRVRARRSR